MDFTSRGGQARPNSVVSNTGNSVQPGGPSSGASQTKPSASNASGSDNHNKLARVGFLVLLFAGTILAVATLLFLAFGKGAYRESKLVDGSKLQAVFINVNGTNGGQVYFGNIKELTPSFIRLSNVFYIQNQQSDAQSNNSAYNLVKLGCELHGPEDMMVINRSEVFFWENLKNDSQVAQKVAEFKKQNPEGQKCNAANQQTQPANQQSGNTQQTNPTPAPASTTPPAANNRQTNTNNNNNNADN